MASNALLGKLLSEHKLADYSRAGLFTCGCFLILPFVFGLWALIASLTYARNTSDADLGFYFSLGLVTASLGLFGLFALLVRLSPAWLKKYELEIYENGFVTILKGKWKVRVERVVNIPLTYGGRAEFMIQNALAATLACFVHGVSLEDIRVGLSTFNSGIAQTPGRLNFVEINDFTVLMDFAHNPAGLKALGNFVHKLSYTKLTGILTGVGDRRDEDLREMGKISAEIFDKLIIRKGNYLRGRSAEEVFGLLEEGVKESGKEIEFKIVSESEKSIFGTFDEAQKGELVVILADSVSKDIAFVNKYRDQILADSQNT